MQEWRIESPQSLDLEGVQRLQIRLVAGSIDVVGRTEDSDAGAAHVEVSQVDGPLIVKVEDGTLVLNHERLTWGGLLDWGDRGRASAVVSISVPAGCSVELGVVSADAVVSGIETEQTKVKSVSGDVTLDGVRSNISAQTVSGDLESRRLAGTLAFTTVSGDLTVVAGTSDSLRAETVSGDVTLDLDLQREGRIEVSSVSGDLTLRLPDSTGLTVDVTSMSGELTSALEGLTTERKPARSRLHGRHGDGASTLRAKTMSGHVTILARAERETT